MCASRITTAPSTSADDGVKKRTTRSKTTAPSTPKDPVKRSKTQNAKPVSQVDIFVPNSGDFRVMTCPDTSLACTAMLNQTNLAENNNKFFLIQALERLDGRGFASWFRWGRVGYTGQTNLTDYQTAEEARNVFLSKFYDKTLNEWSKDIYKKFKPQTRKYTLLPVESLTESVEAADSRGGQVEVVKVEYEESKLDSKICDLIKLISSREMFETELKIAGIDLTRMPLGRISSQMLKDGYKILTQIEAELLRPGGPRREYLADLSGKFYTVIPHSFGFSKAINFMINSFEKLRDKTELLESLAGVKEGVETPIARVEKVSRKPNPVDESYSRLKYGLEVVERDSEEFKLIEAYKNNTQGETHAMRSSIRNIYKLNGEKGRAKKTPRKMLLWHGSRLTNWMSILSSGLRIAPPEAPHTGFMFGKGIYTADCFSKAANYCFVTDTRQRTGLVVLCEVTVGESMELTEADYDADTKLGSQYQSTKGVGRWYPDPSGAVKLKDGTEVPCGKLMSSEVSDGSRMSRRIATQTGLLYNEYIVYNPEQVKMKYLVELDFSR